MKGGHWFTLGIVAFLLLMFAVEYNLPKSFVWRPTFAHEDEQPFGCALFDSLLRVSLPSGYALSRKTFYQLNREDSLNRRGVLVIAESLMLSDLDVASLLSMAERGDKIMLVSTMYNQALEDTLGFSCRPYFFSTVAFKHYINSQREKDSLRWIGDTAVYSPRTFYAYPNLCASYFKSCDSLPLRKLAKKGYWEENEVRRTDSLRKVTDEYLVAWARPWGKGEVILVSTPLLFTNYGILDGGNADYVFRLLSQMDGLPLVRTEAYTRETVEVGAQGSPFRYLLAHKPLRWALYLTMLTIVLFMLFTAKRRQRVIPVMEKPENKSLEFVKLIGTLYYQRQDHADLLRKKFTYFTEALRREIQVNIAEGEDGEESSAKIARKTGMDAERIKRLITEVQAIIHERRGVSAEETQRLIDKMNEIIAHI